MVLDSKPRFKGPAGLIYSLYRPLFSLPSSLPTSGSSFSHLALPTEVFLAPLSQFWCIPDYICGSPCACFHTVLKAHQLWFSPAPSHSPGPTCTQNAPTREVNRFRCWQVNLTHQDQAQDKKRQKENSKIKKIFLRRIHKRRTLPEQINKEACETMWQRRIVDDHICCWFLFSFWDKIS